VLELPFVPVPEEVMVMAMVTPMPIAGLSRAV
jgi:hypothetical protein